jgi:hypothetical protein
MIKYTFNTFNQKRFGNLTNNNYICTLIINQLKIKLMKTNLIFQNLINTSDCLTEKELEGISLTQFSDFELEQLLSKSVGYAEDLILFEFENREN